MTGNGSAGNNRDGFEAWVASLQRPAGAGHTPSDPDLTSALVENSATHVQQIPKELIHRLRERETQGLLGVEVERTAVFKPPPELLARAKRMQPPSKPVSPSEAPAVEATVPTVRPPPPAKVKPLDDDWAELVEPGLDALKPIMPRSVPALGSSRPVAPVFSSAAPPRVAARPVTSSAPASNRSQASGAPASSSAPASNRSQTLGARTSSSAPASGSGPAVVVARTVAVVKSADVGPPPAPPALFAFDDGEPDEPTRIRPDGYASLLGTGTPPGGFERVPSGAVESEGTEPRLSGVVLHADPPTADSFAPEAIERGASERRWVVIAAVFLALVVIGLAALAH